MRKLFIICVFFLVSSYYTMAQEGIDFTGMEWTKALEMAKTQDKLVFVEGYVNWSEACEVIEKFTFTSTEVGTYFNENFINIRIDMETFPGSELGDYYEVNAYPALLFLDGNGEVVHRGCGALESGALLDLARAAKSDTNLLQYIRRFDEGDRSPEFLADFTFMMEDACMDREWMVARYFQEIPQSEWTSDASWTMINLNVFDPFSPQFQYLMSYEDMYRLRFGTDTVDQKIYSVLLDQFIAIYEEEDVTLFATQALKSLMADVSFAQKEELASMVDLKLGDLKQDWNLYARSAARVVREQEVTDADQLNEFAWKFYLYIADEELLRSAKGWMERVLRGTSQATYLDTYASLLYKLGEKKEAVKYAKQAIKAAQLEGEDLMHYEAQLETFSAGK